MKILIANSGIDRWPTKLTLEQTINLQPSSPNNIALIAESGKDFKPLPPLVNMFNTDKQYIYSCDSDIQTLKRYTHDKSVLSSKFYKDKADIFILQEQCQRDILDYGFDTMNIQCYDPALYTVGKWSHGTESHKFNDESRKSFVVGSVNSSIKIEGDNGQNSDTVNSCNTSHKSEYIQHVKVKDSVNSTKTLDILNIHNRMGKLTSEFPKLLVDLYGDVLKKSDNCIITGDFNIGIPLYDKLFTQALRDRAKYANDIQKALQSYLQPLGFVKLDTIYDLYKDFANKTNDYKVPHLTLYYKLKDYSINSTSLGKSFNTSSHHDILVELTDKTDKSNNSNNSNQIFRSNTIKQKRYRLVKG